MLLVPILAPLVLAALAFAVGSPVVRRWLVVVGALIHAAATAVIVIAPPAPMFHGWLAIAPLSRILLGFISAQYLILSLYVPAYLADRAERPDRLFCAALIAIIGPMSAVMISHHLGLMWVSIESATLCTAPLLYFHRTPQSIEATWKYLLIGSVGIALALFGSFFLAYAAAKGNVGTSLLFEDMVRNADHLSKPWLHSAFVVLLVGYGTKIGLAPMHTWKPDAYGEAPGVVGALLAGGLTACAFCALLRFVQIVYAAHDGALARELLLVLGLVSMAVAAVFLARQRDLKRMLAYSSVEHMGIIAFGVGVGGKTGTYGALLHLINNGFGKGVMFLTGGNIQRAYGSRLTDDVAGAIRRVPWSGALFLAGFFAITASPPSGLFLSELTILRSAFGEGDYWAAGVFLLLIAVAFMGMASTVIKIVQGTPPGDPEPRRESALTIVPAFAFLVLVIVLGVYVPGWLDHALSDAARFVENRP